MSLLVTILFALSRRHRFTDQNCETEKLDKYLLCEEYIMSTQKRSSTLKYDIGGVQTSRDENGVLVVKPTTSQFDSFAELLKKVEDMAGRAEGVVKITVPPIR